MPAFICTGWIVTYTIFLLVWAQYYPIICTVYAGTDVRGGLGGGIVATWLAIRFWPLIRFYLVLYLCTIWTLHVIPSYGYGTCGLTSL